MYIYICYPYLAFPLFVTISLSVQNNQIYSLSDISKLVSFCHQGVKSICIYPHSKTTKPSLSHSSPSTFIFDIRGRCRGHQKHCLQNTQHPQTHTHTHNVNQSLPYTRTASLYFIFSLYVGDYQRRGRDLKGTFTHKS